MKPLIKWVGGKRHIAPILESYLPEDWSKGAYYEPFIGGAAMYLHLKPKKAFLSDVNEKLVGFYKNVKTNENTLSMTIVGLAKAFNDEPDESKKEYFLKLRAMFNSGNAAEIKTSSLLFVLNKLCFNGLYRENSKGEFNVPFGQKKQFPAIDLEGFRDVSFLLKGATILAADFEDSLVKAKAGDFAYLDPPYIPVSISSSFTSYSTGGFNLDSQKRLAKVMHTMSQNGVRVMLSNSATDVTKEIFKGLRQVEISAPRMVSAKSSGRGSITELVIMNY